MGDGFVHLSLLQKSIAEVAVGICIVGFDLKSLLIMGIAYGLWRALFVSLEHVFECSAVLSMISISKQLSRRRRDYNSLTGYKLKPPSVRSTFDCSDCMSLVLITNPTFFGLLCAVSS